MSTRVDAEQIETTRSEKVLAVVLSAFLLVGGVWGYTEIDDIGSPKPTEPAFYGGPASISPEDRQALAMERVAAGKLATAQRQRSRAVENLELTREEYRTAIEAGQPPAELEVAYRDSQSQLDAADAAIASAQTELAAAQPAAGQARERQRAAADKQADKERDHDRQTFLLRLLLVAAALGLSYWWLKALRDRSSPYLPLGLAAVGASAALAMVMVGDYGFETIEFEDVGPLAISIIGVAMTAAAFIALQRYISQRIPLWRVRRSECPFCGHPARGNTCCEGCGRKVIAPCAQCQNPRRVGSQHCGECGAA